MSSRISTSSTNLNSADCCLDCRQGEDHRRHERRRRRRGRHRSRVEPTECDECDEYVTSQTGSNSRRRRSRSSTNMDGVSSNPGRSSSVPESSHSSIASGSRTRSGQRRQTARAGRRRSSGSSNRSTDHPVDLVTPSTNPNGGPVATVTSSVAAVTSLAATRVPISSEEEDLSSLGPQEEAKRSQIRQWPHSLSFLLASLSCTVCMFSISRFAILTIDYGVIFLIQFLLLSLIFGIPLLAMFASLGQYLGSGLIDMWRISPIFLGVGVSLMVAQGIYGLYNIAAISWLFIYFRDSFITTSDRYRWSLCFDGIKYGRICESDFNVSNGTYNSWKLEESIPDYFSGIVLMRSAPTYPHSFTALRFQTLFNIVVIWMAVFIALSKGLRSYGKVVYFFGIFPILGFLVFSTKIIGLLPIKTFKFWFMNTQWLEFVYNGQSWICAARECFFTWGIFGACVLQLSSHNNFKHRLLRDTTIMVLITLVILILSGIVGVAIVLLIRSSGYDYTVSSFETSESYEFLRRRTTSRAMRNGREFNLPNYLDKNAEDKEWAQVRTTENPFNIEEILDSLHRDGGEGSFGKDLVSPATTATHNFKFVEPNNKISGYKRSRTSPRGSSAQTNSGRAGQAAGARRDTEHVSFVAGVRILQNGRNTDKYSGYQVMRLATELVPAYAAILGPRILSPFWTVLFYLTMIIMGLAQQMALFHTIASGLIAIRPDHFLQFESSLTFMSCLLGLVLCFPMATEFGAFIVYFFDYTIGCGWWLMLLYAMLMFAVFVIRGKPYTGEHVATLLLKPERLQEQVDEVRQKVCCCCASCIIPLLAFSWTVLLPVGLVILCIVSFKTCYFSEMFDWTTHTGYLYLPSWVREIGAMLQLMPILLVPFVAIIQTCRFFLSGSGELYEKINRLYRPAFACQIQHRAPRPIRPDSRGRRGRNRGLGVVLTNYTTRSQNSDRGQNDPPPKYTPPPSYSTATGARIARFLRQSFRQSVRHFRGETSRQNSSGNVGSVVARDDEIGIDNFAFQMSTLDRLKINDAADDNEGTPPPPDYATVIIETNRQSNLSRSDTSYGSFSRTPSVNMDLTSASAISTSSSIISGSRKRSTKKDDGLICRRRSSSGHPLKSDSDDQSEPEMTSHFKSLEHKPDIEAHLSKRETSTQLKQEVTSSSLQQVMSQSRLEVISQYRPVIVSPFEPIMTSPFEPDMTSPFEPDMTSPPSYELATEMTSQLDDDGATKSKQMLRVDTDFRNEISSAEEDLIESEKPKHATTTLRLDESSTDPIYSEGSTFSFGHSEILPDGFNRLDSSFVRELNDLDEEKEDSRRRFEPRTLVFNIPPTPSVDQTSNSPSSDAIVVLHVDNTTSVI